jgi:hypothetical protein
MFDTVTAALGVPNSPVPEALQKYMGAPAPAPAAEADPAAKDDKAKPDAAGGKGDAKKPKEPKLTKAKTKKG